MTLNKTVTGRFVTLYLNGTGTLQLYEVMVFGSPAVPGKSSTKPFEGLNLYLPKRMHSSRMCTDCGNGHLVVRGR